MKKSEALKTLGLADGATDDEVKQAHRKLVIAHHPDKFALDSPERAEAEELTKRINEARDVLLNRSWTPEFDPRRDPRPYANKPYAHPGRPGSSAAPGGTAGQDPFAGWPFAGGQGSPFGQGQGTGPAPGRTTYVWTSWDGTRTAGGDPGVGGPFDPFDPFAPFRAAEPRKTPQQVLAEAVRSLRSEALAVAGKAAVLAVAALLGSVATGLFFYVMISLVWGLWKRLGSCLIGFIVPIALLGAPFVFLIAPRQGAVTVGLAVFFLAAVLFDVKNLRNALRAYRAAKRAARA